MGAVILRTTNPDDLVKVFETYPDAEGFEPVEWVANQDNVAYYDGDNLALFEKGSDGVYSAHYFFTVRGKAARELAVATLDRFFTETGTKVIRGLTPLANRAARWMSRQLGFKSAGAVTTPYGNFEMFVLTPNDLRESSSLKERHA